MEIEYIDYERLEKARKLQQDCIELNILPPPILSFELELIRKGIKIRHIKAKSNSFIRNAYNAITHLAAAGAAGAFSALSYNDGVISYKDAAGNIRSGLNTFFTTAMTAYANRHIIIGTGTTPDELNDYTLETPITSGITSSGVSATTYFETGSRKLITEHVRTFVNTSGSTIDITESALVVGQSTTALSSFNMVLIRDVFDAVEFLNGDSIKFTYSTEVAFP